MKQMGTVPIDPNAGFFVEMVVAIATNVIAFFHHVHRFVKGGGVPFGYHGTRKSSPNNANVMLFFARWWW
jgi:hypothetical protein